MSGPLDENALDMALGELEDAETPSVTGPALLRFLLVRGRELWQTRYRAEVVAEVPANAPRGLLMVTPGDPHLYIGAGPSQRVRRVVTEATPT